MSPPKVNVSDRLCTSLLLPLKLSCTPPAAAFVSSSEKLTHRFVSVENREEKTQTTMFGHVFLACLAFGTPSDTGPKVNSPQTTCEKAQGSYGPLGGFKKKIITCSVLPPSR